MKNLITIQLLNKEYFIVYLHFKYLKLIIMKTKILFMVLLAIFSLGINAQTKDATKDETKEVKPLNFNIEKVMANIEKITTGNYTVGIKGTIDEKIDENKYWLKDRTGRIKINIPSGIISDVQVGELYYIVGKINNSSEKIVEISEISQP